ncbi:endoribonuclease L-PSP [Pedobacter antarcticus 4BY]|uniref:Endoribonuclease L-PSP n=2 Tax=Pedobacter antarcticus TaxID=34086 RepID=A0A081PF82_9SPHI|nr:RidA family protein [Pedobacter antarcticus]KEQ29355.1 endoribonuclease L-PSP [Pedobacter antarcticus 4BY]
MEVLAIVLCFLIWKFELFKIRNMIQFKNSEKVFKINGLSQVVEIPLGNQKMLVLSGQIPLNQKGELVGNDVRTQTVQIFENVKAILESCGASLNDIIKLGIFITDISQTAVYREVRDQYINLETPPTSTLLEVKGLFRADIFIEIEVTAIVAN